MLEDLQEAVSVALNFFPIVRLENKSVANIIGQVLHLAAPHGQLPSASYGTHINLVLTKISLRFFGQQKVIRDGSGNAPHNRSEV